MKTYAIYEGNMPRLESKLKRIQNKCKKYGCTFHYEQVGEEFRTVKTEDGKDRILRFVLVEAEGKALLNGWRFVATLDHTDKGNVINSVEGAPELPERFYTCPPYCEHCKTNRYRKSSFVVQNTSTGEFKQVGANCLGDYTHGMSAEGVTSWLSLFEELVQGEAIYPSSKIIFYYNVHEMLCYYIETVKHFGYVRSSDPNSTVWESFDFYLYDHDRTRLGMNADNVWRKMNSVNYKAITPENERKAEECIAWVEEQEESSNYMHNLKTVCLSQCVTAKNLGVVASVLPTMNKDLERKAEQKRMEKSNYVGKVGERITVEVTSFKLLTSWENNWGFTRLYKIVDATGNVYVWKTSNNIEEDVVKIVGTIKAHNEFRGVKQTELTRCKVSIVKGE